MLCPRIFFFFLFTGKTLAVGLNWQREILCQIWGHLWWSWLGAKGGIASGIYWTEALGAAKYPAMHRTATHDKELAKMSVVLRLRNPALARPTSVELPACTALCCAPFFLPSDLCSPVRPSLPPLACWCPIILQGSAQGLPCFDFLTMNNIWSPSSELLVTPKFQAKYICRISAKDQDNVRF